MRSVVTFIAGSSALVALLFTASCLEPDRSNGESCLAGGQCKSSFCRAGVCAVRPPNNQNSNLPPPVDAASHAASDAPADAALDGLEQADVVGDAPEDVVPDGLADAPQDGLDEADIADATDADNEDSDAAD